MCKRCPAPTIVSEYDLCDKCYKKKINNRKYYQKCREKKKAAYRARYAKHKEDQLKRVCEL